jgi:RNA polymerase sigma factor (TIGR02999 family)
MSVPPNPTHEITQLLLDWSEGNQAALDKLLPLVYNKLRRLARRYLSKECPGQTLQTTDLVHEAYLRLVDQRRVQWQNRAQFFGVAAQLMRRILVDRARRHKRIKRGAGAPIIPLDEAVVASDQSSFDVLALDEALNKLAEIDGRKARVVELRFFGGLEVEETAASLNISEVTVMRDWKMAKAWLHRELAGQSDKLGKGKVREQASY